MRPPNGTLLLVRDIGTEWERSQVLELARHLELRLHQPVSLWIEQDASPPLVDAIQLLVDAGVTRLTVLPIGLLAIPERGAIPRSFSSVKRQNPNVLFQLAAPLTWMELSGWLRTSALDTIRQSGYEREDTGVLLVGHSYPDSMMNANLACLAHLIRESGSLAAVGHAFFDGLQPTVSEAIRSMARTGLGRVVVLPWLLFNSELLKRLNDEIQTAGLTDHIKVQLTQLSLIQPTLINLLVANHLAAKTIDVVDSSVKNPIESETADELLELETRINAMLPPEYRGQYETVSPKSMGTASLKLDENGKVAWDQIWTSFCDLALAGGPPHRGTLLEAVTAEEANAEREQYDAVVEEIGRGIQMVTFLPIVKSKSAGWVGVRCQNEEMAVWLMRAIIVENIMVRREGDVIYLPAGPRFTVKREIKNVITAVAKTVHYWTAHLNAKKSTT